MTMPPDSPAPDPLAPATPSLPAPPAPATLVTTADEADKAERLRVMKVRATALLVGFAVLFLVTRLLEADYPWLGIIRATAEAAMVGGLADWFAVTALFRHPMGIPIPHTAIVPTRKDRIGRSLGNFVQHNFLRGDVIARRMHGLRVSERIARWLAQPENARRLAKQLAGGLARATEALPDDEMKGVVHRGLVSRGHALRVAPILGDVLQLVVADQKHQVLLDRALELVDRFVAANREIIRERIAQETPWWVPTAVDDKLYQKIVGGIERILDEARTQPGHPLRRQFDKVLHDFIRDLEQSPEVIARAEGMKDTLLEQPVVAELSASLWEAVRTAMLRFGEPGAEVPAPLERALASVGDAVLSNEELLSELDDAITGMTINAVEQYRGEVAAVIERTVAEWDAHDASRRIEVQVGRDLQFIRINGTLVGGLVGLLLYLLSTLMPGPR
ncbi:MAG: DUF445 domain-containing protein [Gemmatimonadaceae bacterium]